MIVNYLNVVRVSIAPRETNTPLVIDSYAVLSLALTRQDFKPVCRRHTQVIQAHGRIKHPQFPQCHFLYVMWQSPGPRSFE